MADMTTIARPYAKAIFEHAQSKEQLAEWSATLHVLAEAIIDPTAESFISEPSTSDEQRVMLLLSISPLSKHPEESKALKNFLSVLAHYKRLQILLDVYIQYEALRADFEKTLTVEVRSFAPLTNDQQQKLMTMLSKRLQREISLDIKIDESLIGGAVIMAGDLVIDGSVRGKLNKLQTSLAA